MRRQKHVFHKQDKQKHVFFHQKNNRANRNILQGDTDVGIAENDFKINIISMFKDLKKK